ncbi:MAG: FAD-dependent oxidoreductase, partial [bacterium]|nr:FAD-dependent oxidoreductase [bacterium]
NYITAKELLTEDDQTSGLKAVDETTGKTCTFNAPVVINAAGPWSREVAAQLHQDHQPLFKKRLLVWNILFNREALSNHALGLSVQKGGGHTYFFHPWKNRLLVGTGEIVVDKNETTVPPAELEKFIDDMNKIVPALKLQKKDIQRIYTGILPAGEQGKMANREVIYHHADGNGPRGLYSISGVKFTTSRLVAEKILDRVFPDKTKLPHDTLFQKMEKGNLAFDYNWEPQNDADLEILKQIVADEAVVHLDDLVLRRTSLADHPERGLNILPELKPLFLQWDDNRWQEEVERVKNQLTPVL